MPPEETTERGAIATTRVKPFQFRGRFLTAIALRVAGPVDGNFYAALDEHLSETPQFFTNAPLVVDLEDAASGVSPAQLNDLVDALRTRGLLPFGVQHADGHQMDVARRLGLIPVSGGRDVPQRAPLQAGGAAAGSDALSGSSDAGRGKRTARADGHPSARVTEAVERARRKRDGLVLEPDDVEVAAAPAPVPAPEPPAPDPVAPRNMIITEPVRSGQMIVAEHGDLTVIGPVSSGAELIAAGSIHIYGAMRGRAMAGAHGDETARIFCQSLQAELVAIAGLYRTSETLENDVLKRSVQIFLQGERLRVEALT